MRIPGFDTLSRIPVPAVVRAVLDPVLRPATAYVAAVPGKLDRLADQIIAEVLRRVDLDEPSGGSTSRPCWTAST
jgi:hypothetical protein